MNIDTLLALQAEDGRIRMLRHEQKTLLPARRAAADKRLKVAEEAVRIAEEEHTAIQREYARYQNDFAQQRNSMLRAERNALSQKHARGLAAATAEYEAAQRALAAAEAASTRIDQSLSPSERRLDIAREFYVEEELAVQGLTRDIETRAGEVAAELARLQDVRAALAEKIPPALLAQYERLILTRWPGVVELDTASITCTGCNLSQPRSVKQQLEAARNSGSDAPVCCPNCGRILY